MFTKHLATSRGKVSISNYNNYNARSCLCRFGYYDQYTYPGAGCRTPWMAINKNRLGNLTGKLVPLSGHHCRQLHSAHEDILIRYPVTAVTPLSLASDVQSELHCRFPIRFHHPAIMVSIFSSLSWQLPLKSGYHGGPLSWYQWSRTTIGVTIGESVLLTRQPYSLSLFKKRDIGDSVPHFSSGRLIGDPLLESWKGFTLPDFLFLVLINASIIELNNLKFSLRLGWYMTVSIKRNDHIESWYANVI